MNSSGSGAPPWPSFCIQHESFSETNILHRAVRVGHSERRLSSNSGVEVSSAREFRNEGTFSCSQRMRDRNSCGRRKWTRALLAATFYGACEGWYLPGTAPEEYNEGERIELKVNSITSVRTQLPYSYYSLPFCRPTNLEMESGSRAESIGETLLGDDVQISPYEIYMLKNTYCNILCTQPLDDNTRGMLQRTIQEEYIVNWLIDNMPAAVKVDLSDETEPTSSGGDDNSQNADVGDTEAGAHDVDGGLRPQGGEAAEKPQPIYSVGWPIGFEHNGRFFLHNHVSIKLEYQQSRADRTSGLRIVAFEVVPISMEHVRRSGSSASSLWSCAGDVEDADTGNIPPFDIDHDQVVFSYDVTWVKSATKWEGRWDRYLNMQNGSVHWFSLVNSFLIVFFLSGLVALILLRTLTKDINAYNALAKAVVEANSGVSKRTGFRKSQNKYF